MKKENLGRIREQVDVKDLLNRLGIEFEDANPNEIFIRCRSGSHPDNNPSMRIRSDIGDDKNGVFHCDSCKWNGDVYTLVQKVKKISFQASIVYVKGSHDSKFFERAELERQDYMKSFRRYAPARCAEPLGLLDVMMGSRCIEYLAERGFGWEEIEKYGIKDLPMQRRVYIPITVDKKLVSWIGRTYSDSDLRVLTPQGNGLGNEWSVFGLDQADKKIRVGCLSEGWGSAMRVDQAGFPNSMALCGSTLTERQVQLLSWLERIIVWQEGDFAGRKLTRDVKFALGHGRKIDVVAMPEKRDPANFMPWQLINFFDRRQKS